MNFIKKYLQILFFLHCQASFAPQLYDVRFLSQFLICHNNNSALLFFEKLKIAEKKPRELNFFYGKVPHMIIFYTSNLYYPGFFQQFKKTIKIGDNCHLIYKIV